jgi:hypothetical protein
MSSDETIWVTDPAPPVASTRLIRASVYAEKSARVWDGGDNVFIDLFIGHLELSGAIRAWREVAETLNAAIDEIDRFLLERDGLAADVPDAVKRRALDAIASEIRQREAAASEARTGDEVDDLHVADGEEG